MAGDDWRVRIEVEGDDEARGFMERLRHGIGQEAKELADALRDDHLVVSGEGNELYVYADSRAQAEQARKVIEAESQEHGLTTTVSEVEHWLANEERWDNEPPDETWEDEVEARGFAPWEVRVTCPSHDDADALADRLEAEGYAPVRRWRYLVIGTDTEEAAQALAERLHGEVEVGGALVWNELLDSNVVRPFTIF
jgi:hypothetical protein